MTTETILLNCMISGVRKSICEENGEHEGSTAIQQRVKAVVKIVNLVHVKDRMLIFVQKNGNRSRGNHKCTIERIFVETVFFFS